MISCLRGLLIVVIQSALSPKITGVHAGDGCPKLGGGGINAALFPSSEDAGRMELIAAAQS